MGVVLNRWAELCASKLNCQIKVHELVDPRVWHAGGGIKIQKKTYELEFISPKGQPYQHTHKIKSVAEGKKFLTALMDMTNAGVIRPADKDVNLFPYNQLTPERRACLETVVKHGGLMNHDDPALAPFCDDKSTLTHPDIFNQCHEAGWLCSSHNHDTSNSHVRVTDEGHRVLKGDENGISRTDPLSKL